MRSFLLFLTLLFFFVSAAAAADLLQVQNIRYGEQENKTRLVFDLNHSTEFRAFALDNPYRIVVDLPPARWNTYTSRAIMNGLVKGWRSGRIENGLTRVIFDVRKPAVVDSIFIEPRNGLSKDRLVVDVAAVSANAFNARKNDVAGNRNLAVPPGTPARSGLAAPETSDLARAVVPGADTAAQKTANQKYTVVIDAGHGGEDPGAMAFGVKEKYITFSIAKELKRQMEETGRYKVVLTRDHDVYIKLRERLAMSRQVKGDLFISIHADKISRIGVRGASIYTLSEKASDAETAKIAEDENNAGFVAGVDLSQESQDVADILLDLAMREKMNESNLFARMLGDAFHRQGVRLLPNSHRSAGFAVLKAPDVPSVLIESGFISNPAEAKLLSSGQFQRNISMAILSGVDAYFRKMQALHKP